MDDLNKFRCKIDELDEQLIMILKSRYDICVQVAHYKIANNLPMMQPERIKAVINKCVNLGKKNGLGEDFVTQLYTLIIDQACKIEDVLFSD